MVRVGRVDGSAALGRHTASCDYVQVYPRVVLMAVGVRVSDGSMHECDPDEAMISSFGLGAALRFC